MWLTYASRVPSWRQCCLVVQAAAIAWREDRAQSMGAALAYYAMFSIAPLLLIAISVAGMIFGQEAARGEIYAQLNHLMGEQGALVVQNLLESTRQPSQGMFATAIGLGLLLIGATTVFGELQQSLDTIWRVEAQTDTGLWQLIRTRLLSFGMVLGVGFLLMVSLLFSAAISALSAWWAPLFRGWVLLASVCNVVFSFVLTTGMFAMIYKIMPRTSIRWVEVWMGAAMTAALFTGGKWLIGLYIGRSAFADGYGPAGAVLALLVWIYYSAQIFLLGAELTRAYSLLLGERQAHKPVPALLFHLHKRTS